MSYTYRQIAEDVMLALGETVDDAELSLGRITFWIKVYCDRLMAQRAQKALRSSQERRDSGSYINLFLVEVETDPVEQMQFFTLPATILPLDRDSGIEFISYYRDDLPPNCPKDVEKLQFARTRWSYLPQIQSSTYQRPSSSRPYFCLGHSHLEDTVGPNRVYLPGVSSAISQVQVGLLMSTPPLATIDIDSPVPIDDDQVALLIQFLLDLGNWSMRVPQQRLLNDGRDSKAGELPAAAVGKTSSVNNPTVIPD